MIYDFAVYGTAVVLDICQWLCFNILTRCSTSTGGSWLMFILNYFLCSFLWLFLTSSGLPGFDLRSILGAGITVLIKFYKMYWAYILNMELPRFLYLCLFYWIFLFISIFIYMTGQDNFQDPHYGRSAESQVPNRIRGDICCFKGFFLSSPTVF